MRTALIGLLLAACVTTDVAHQPTAPTYLPGQIVTFGGFEFLLDKAWTGNSYTWNKGLAEVTSDTGFVLVDVAAASLRSKPVPYALQPVYRLIDDAGHEYEPSLQHSIQFNFPKQAALDAMNPKVARRWTWIFEAPPQNYRLRVITPVVATASFMNESVNVQGRFFYYDLAGTRGSQVAMR